MHSLFGMGSQIFRGDPGIWDLEIPNRDRQLTQQLRAAAGIWDLEIPNRDRQLTQQLRAAPRDLGSGDPKVSGNAKGASPVASELRK